MGPTDGLSLKIWKQQKLIDFLEESEEIDVDALLKAYNALTSLHREAGDLLAIKEAEANMESLRSMQEDNSSMTAIPNASPFDDGVVTFKSEEKGEDIDERGRSAGFQFEREYSTGSSRPTSSIIRERSASPSSRSSSADGYSRLTTAKTRPTTSVPPGSAAIHEATDESTEIERQLDCNEVAAVDQAYLQIAPLVDQLAANAKELREMAYAECMKEGQRIQKQCVGMLEEKLRVHDNALQNSRNEGKDSVTPDPKTFVFWYDDLLDETDKITHEYISSSKSHLIRQIETEKAAWMKMAQMQLDSTQEKHGASEAAVHVEVLVHEFKKAEADMVRWELGIISEMQELVQRLMAAWRSRAKNQVSLEREMHELRIKNTAAHQSFLPSIKADSKTTNQNIFGGSASPDQQKQLNDIAKSLQYTTMPASHTQNSIQLNQLQDQIAEWKRHALRHIENEANQEMTRWRLQIDETDDPEEKIAIIDEIEKERTKRMQSFASDAASAQVQYDIEGNIISSSPKAEEKGQEKWREDFKKSMINFHEQNPITAKNVDGSNSLVIADNTLGGSSAQSPMGPSAQTTVRFDEEMKKAELDSERNAQSIVAEELKQLELQKQIEIDHTIREQKMYAQAELTQKLKEEAEEAVVQNRLQKMREEAEAEEAAKQKEEAMKAIMEAESEALQDMESEWARLQAIMAREKESKLTRMKKEQEEAEARYGVTTRQPPPIGEMVKVGKKVGKKTSSAAVIARNKNIAKKGGVKGLDIAPPQKKKLELGEKRNYNDVEREAALVTNATKNDYNVSIVAESEIFKSFLSKAEKIEKLEKIQAIKAQQKIQATSSTYSTGLSGSKSTSYAMNGSIVLTTNDENPLDTDINPLAELNKGIPSRDDAVGTGFNTVVDPRIKFSRSDRPVIITVTPKETTEVSKVVHVRQSADLMSMLDEAKKKHLDDVKQIYTDEQPKLILGQKHTTSGSTSANTSKPGSPSGRSTRPTSKGSVGGGGRPGSTNNYREFTPDDRNPDGRVLHNADLDEYEDDGFTGMQPVQTPLTEEEEAKQRQRVDGRPDVEYMRPSYTPENSNLHTRTGKYILDSKMPEEPRPLSPNNSLYGSGAMNVKAFSHVPGNDGTIGLVTEKHVRTLIGATSDAMIDNNGTDTTIDAVSIMASSDISEQQNKRMQGMTAQQRNDFIAYHGSQVIGTLGSGLDQDSMYSAAELSQQQQQQNKDGTMKPLPNFVNRPIKHLTATGTTSLGITGSPDKIQPKASNTKFKCPHPGCNAIFNVAFELFNHANRTHAGIVGDLAHNPVADQDYYYEEPNDRIGQKALSHSNSDKHRHNDPYTSNAPIRKINPTKNTMGTKQFVKKIRIPVDQVINRKPRSKPSPTKAIQRQPGTGYSPSNKSGIYNISMQHSGSLPSVNSNTEYDQTLMNPTLGSPNGSYSGGDDAYDNSFLTNSYSTMNSAKSYYMQKYISPNKNHSNKKKSSESPLAKFNPAVVSLSKKWEEQQQMDLWSNHTKLLKDWRKTYEKQLSLKTRPLPTGGFARRTKDDHVTKAEPQIK